jgi:hypothetical protein
LNKIKDTGINNVFLETYFHGRTIFPSEVMKEYGFEEQNPDFDFDVLAVWIKEAHKRGIKVILDLVVNHSSSEHPWFKEACQYIKEHGEPGGEYGDYYNFTKNGGTGFSAVSGTSYYYESRFWSGMPDLNLNSENVKNGNVTGEFKVTNEGYYRDTALEVVVTNKAATQYTYYITIEAVDEDGTRLATDTIFADTLNAGQKIRLTAFEYVPEEQINEFKNATFKVLEIHKYAF